MKKILNSLILSIFWILLIFILYKWYLYIDVNKKIWNQASLNISIDLPEFYNIWINDTMLASYLLKVWYFQFDKNTTYDGVFNKNWLPLSYNFCNSKLGTNIYEINSDFDNDWLDGINDKYPFDYSNWYASVRNSTSLDFDNDWIVNAFDTDADWNNVSDIYQSICFDWVNEKWIEERKWFWWNEWNKFITNKELYIQKIRENLISKIPNQEIINMELFEQWIDIIYNKLLFNDDIIYQVDGKNYYINKNDILEESFDEIY